MDGKYTITALFGAINKAKEAANALSNYTDYGTHNLDTPAIKLPDDIDVSEFNADEDCKLNGFSIEAIDSPCWKGFYFINGICNGMQIRRTKQAEAVVDSLTKQGYMSVVYYQTDQSIRT